MTARDVAGALTLGWILVLAVPATGPLGAGETAAERTSGEGAVSGDGGGPALFRLLFIHHSCGGQLLAAPGEPVGGGPDSGARCIHESHPNGGGLRDALAAAGFEVHEASYGSVIGEDTDVHDWRAKFAGRMDEILRCDRNDRLYEDGRTNHIVVFKSCFPNNRFVGEGTEPGDPDAEELTVANARAAYRALLPLFRERPEVLFVAVTAPPLAEPRPSGFLERMKWWFGGRPRTAEWACAFNGWLADPDVGWLADYPLPNVAVFDYYDILTGRGGAGWSAYPTGGGRDSHPSREGNTLAARAFTPFLLEAVRQMETAGGAAAGSRTK